MLGDYAFIIIIMSVTLIYCLVLFTHTHIIIRDFKVLDTNKSKLQQKRERGWSVSHFGAGPFSLIQYNPEHFQNFLPDRGARKNTNVLRSWITYKSLCI